MAESEDDDNTPTPEEWIRDAVRKMFEGGQGFDPAELAKAAGFSGDPAQLQAMVESFAQGLGHAMKHSETSARDHAVSVAAHGAVSVDPARAEALALLLGTAALWLNESTDIAEPEGRPLLMTRQEWTRATLPVWQEMAEPVATALGEAIASLMKDQVPDEIGGLLGDSSVLVSMTTGLFKLQLAQVVGGLSKEVLSAGDIGIPLMHAGSDSDVRSGLVPQNMAAFSDGLGVPSDEVDYYLAIRELAHQRLFRHARWLRAHVLSLVGDFARGIHIDGDKIMDLAESIDPSHPDQISQILSSGQLLPERTDAQERALVRLETMLALIEGWVDHVTEVTAHRLPNAIKIGEAIRRRRATGGPAEHAFKTLVGLELRPRRLREASALWSSIHQSIGAAGRDALWSHPDHLPTEVDLDSPDSFLARLSGVPTDESDVDKFLDDLFGDQASETPTDET